MAISTTGTMMIVRHTATCLKRGGISRRPRYQATLIGITSFMISDGWKVMTPGMLSQRWAPLASVPTTNTASSSNEEPT